MGNLKRVNSVSGGYAISQEMDERTPIILTRELFGGTMRAFTSKRAKKRRPYVAAGPYGRQCPLFLDGLHTPNL